MKTILVPVDFNPLATAALRHEHQPDLVVMGTHGRGALSRLMFGSVARAVLRATTVPVVTIDRAEASKP